MMELVGRWGERVTLDGRRVLIATHGREGLCQRMIPLEGIVSVEVSVPGAFSGDIELVLAGEPPQTLKVHFLRQRDYLDALALMRALRSARNG